MIKTIPTLSFTDALKASTSRIFQFEGRTRRSEFWWTQLVVFIATMVLTPLIGLLLDLLTIPLVFRRLHDTGRSGWWWGAGVLLKMAFLVFVVDDLFEVIANSGSMDDEAISAAVAFVLKYGLYIFIVSAYQVVLLIFFCIDSEPFENRYGPSPKYVDDSAGSTDE